MASPFAESANVSQAPIAFLLSAPASSLRHKARVIGSLEILRQLDRLGVERKEIAELLGVDNGAVTRLFYALEENPKDTPRQLKHDEAVKLVEAYQLEPSPPPLPPPVWRLIARHIASRLALPLREDDERLQELVAELAGFSRFVRNRQVQGLLQATEHYFEAMRSRQEPELVGPSGNDPQPAR